MSPISYLSSDVAAFLLISIAFSILDFWPMYEIRSNFSSPTFLPSQKSVNDDFSGNHCWILLSNLKPEFILNLSLNLASEVCESTLRFLVSICLSPLYQITCRSYGSETTTWAVTIAISIATLRFSTTFEVGAWTDSDGDGVTSVLAISGFGLTARDLEADPLSAEAIKLLFIIYFIDYNNN